MWFDLLFRTMPVLGFIAQHGRSTWLPGGAKDDGCWRGRSTEAINYCGTEAATERSSAGRLTVSRGKASSFVEAAPHEVGTRAQVAAPITENVCPRGRPSAAPGLAGPLDTDGPSVVRGRRCRSRRRSIEWAAAIVDRLLEKTAPQAQRRRDSSMISWQGGDRLAHGSIDNVRRVSAFQVK